jgi:DNA-3-methyladenine glycosylase I
MAVSNLNYSEIFAKTEKTLLAQISGNPQADKIRKDLEEFKTYEGRRLSDDDFFSILTEIVFYAGFKADTVTKKIAVIRDHFPGFKTVSGYGEDKIAQILSDPQMIKNSRKVNACVENAKCFVKVVKEYGSFQDYVDSFRPTDSDENLKNLRDDLKSRLSFLGGVTVYHFMMDIGLRVLKPDLVISRMFRRLGAIDDESQSWETVIQGRKFADATGLPIRYVDIIFVIYGQVSAPDLGIDRGICLKQPRCEACGLTSDCHYYRSRQ